MRLEAQCFQGVPGGTVEMKEARLGRWHIVVIIVAHQPAKEVEMKEARLGRWHLKLHFVTSFRSFL